jgi:hypothetical protein
VVSASLAGSSFGTLPALATRGRDPFRSQSREEQGTTPSSDSFPSDQREGARCLSHQPIDAARMGCQVSVVLLHHLDPIAQPLSNDKD